MLIDQKKERNMPVSEIAAVKFTFIYLYIFALISLDRFSSFSGIFTKKESDFSQLAAEKFRLLKSYMYAL